MRASRVCEDNAERAFDPNNVKEISSTSKKLMILLPLCTPDIPMIELLIEDEMTSTKNVTPLLVWRAAGCIANSAICCRRCARRASSSCSESIG